MKMDRETIVVLALSAAAIFIWYYFFPMGQSETREARNNSRLSSNSIQQQEAEKSSSTETPESKPAKSAENKKTVSAKKTKHEKIPESADKLPLITISNDFIILAFDPNTGGIESVRLKKYLNSKKTADVILDQNVIPPALSFHGLSEWNLEDIKILDKTANSLQVKRQLLKNRQPFEITQTFRLGPGYVSEYDAEIRNTGRKVLHFNELSVSAGGIPPLKYLTGDTDVRRESHCVEYCLKTGKVDSVYTTVGSTPEKDRKEEAKFISSRSDNPMLWVGVSNKYFTCILKPEKLFENGNVLYRKVIQGSEELGGAKYCLISSGGSFGNTVSIEPDASVQFKMKYFTGPKELSLLNKFSETTSGIMHLSFLPDWFPGSSIVEWISQALMIALTWLKGICGSYGWSIIILTVIVRMIFWPVTQKANASMKKMQRIQPMVKELKEKYKDDPKELQARTMMLYKEYKVNPLGGCLPILLQIPVFIALYSALDGAVQLRQTSFLWCYDLSKPDTIATVFGMPIHPLIIAMTLLMLLQQKLTPSAADPAQQKMMMIMPLVMLVLLYNLPSGLTLYWTVSQVISIIQLVVNNKMSKDETSEGKAVAKAKT